MKYPIIMLNTSKLFFILLPFWYVVTFPFALVLNFLDVTMKHRSGTGLIVKVQVNRESITLYSKKISLCQKEPQRDQHHFVHLADGCGSRHNCPGGDPFSIQRLR